MSEDAQPLDGDTLKFGLLMESAEAHQKMAEAHLAQLRTHTDGLDGIVREEIRRTLTRELSTVTTETRAAAQALRGMQRAANLRALLSSLAMSGICTAVPTAIVRWALPSAAEIADLRARRDALAENVTHLEQQGGRVEWRRCGTAVRLCVRVDRKAPAYGDAADYYIVKGY